ncbi:MAG: hypothetical protein WDZ91_08545 [Paenibacillaceae bacterium]
MMNQIVNNLGIPPLAGICDYGAAVKPGYDVERTVNLLKRYNYVKSRLLAIFSAHLAKTPEWEVKCAIGFHLWLESEHAASIRKRVSEMREPPLHMDKVPDPKLETLMEEVIRADNTVELLTGIYGVIKPDMIRSIQKHMAELNPLADHPTLRMLKIILSEEEEMVAWGKQAADALISASQSDGVANNWKKHVEHFLALAGGIDGASVRSGENANIRARADGNKYEMNVVPQRDSRFVDVHNRAGKIDDYYKDENLSPEERTFALLYKRLREMDVPEWLGPVLYKTKGKPWEYYVDVSRQLWDEVRHAMMGEVGIVAADVPFYKYPVCVSASEVLNKNFAPIESQLVLWGIEQGLMHKHTGKRWEWDIAKTSNNQLAVQFQDYDWADEVLHTQIGRKWLLPEYNGLEDMNSRLEPLYTRWLKIMDDEFTPKSEQRNWWPDFMEDIRKQKEKVLL